MSLSEIGKATKTENGLEIELNDVGIREIYNVLLLNELEDGEYYNLIPGREFAMMFQFLLKYIGNIEAPVEDSDKTQIKIQNENGIVKIIFAKRT